MGSSFLGSRTGSKDGHRISWIDPKPRSWTSEKSVISQQMRDELEPFQSLTSEPVQHQEPVCSGPRSASHGACFKLIRGPRTRDHASLAVEFHIVVADPDRPGEITLRCSLEQLREAIADNLRVYSQRVGFSSIGVKNLSERRTWRQESGRIPRTGQHSALHLDEVRGAGYPLRSLGASRFSWAGAGNLFSAWNGSKTLSVAATTSADLKATSSSRTT